jgi:hypothetical protein
LNRAAAEDVRSWHVQFSLFGAEAAKPGLADLDGLLIAGGDWLRREVETDGASRLSILVADTWRADALVAELRLRGLNPDTVPAPADMIAVRTELTPILTELARTWRRGASLRVPPGLQLSPAALRLWAIATGQRDAVGYLLASAERNPDLHRAGGSQLARLGLAGMEISARPGPGWRITSAKRLRRLAELIGHPPDGAGDNWPEDEQAEHPAARQRSSPRRVSSPIQDGWQLPGA